jgi:hypothetical protein
MWAVLGQLDTPRILRLIGWMLREGLPQGDAVLASILAADQTGTGQYLQSVVAQANRPLFSRGCSPLTGSLPCSRPASWASS